MRALPCHRPLRHGRRPAPALAPVLLSACALLLCANTGRLAQARPAPDVGPPAPDMTVTLPDIGPLPGLGYVLNSIDLPGSSLEAIKYALVYKGTKYNALGNLLAVLVATSSTLDIQEGIDTTICSGEAMHLLEIQGNSLVTEPMARGQAWIGAQRSCCSSGSWGAACCAQAATGCFNGMAKLQKSKTSPNDMVFAGSITAGALTLGPGNKLVVRLKYDAVTMDLPLTYVTFRGQIDAKGIRQGILTGAVPQYGVQNILVPGVAQGLNDTYTDPYTDSGTRLTLGMMFDTNNDGKITAAELANNSLFKPFLAGDVDVDGDNVKEMSLGVGFAAVRAKLLDPPFFSGPEAGVGADAGFGLDAGAADAAAADRGAGRDAPGPEAPDAGVDAPAVKGDGPPPADQGGAGEAAADGCDCAVADGAEGGAGGAGSLLLLLALALRRPRQRSQASRSSGRSSRT